ncbi:hypothetical protein [Vaginisenegalia massiliensis]|uniref:hypothetical protein n=1 Tax=Vaginisenegalia massiliensis TaxID=2058294 RepID=UPI000F52D078|nr:hypothetical protein [Vaginisenegalia massiliensis]
MNTEEYIKTNRLIIVYLGVATLIQILVLLAYYFKEKQTILAFPMLLGLVMTLGALVKLIKIDRQRR